MIERHSVEFDRVIFNVISDADRRTIILQFESIAGSERKAIHRILSAIGGRFGDGIANRLRRWSAGQGNPMVLPARGTSHPECPDVLCFVIAVKPGEKMENACATLLDFVRQLPGYRQTYGSPLDRDEEAPRVRNESPRELTSVAQEILQAYFRRWEERRKEMRF